MLDVPPLLQSFNPPILRSSDPSILHPRSSILSLFLSLFTLLLLASPAGAHTARMPSALLSVRPDGSYHLDLSFDVLAYSLDDTPQRITDAPMLALLQGPDSDLADALADASDRFLHGFRLRTDAGPGKNASIRFPTVATLRAYQATRPEPLLPALLELQLDGHLPPSAHSLQLRFPESLGTIVLTLERPGEEPRALALDPDSWSPDFAIQLAPAPQPLASANPSPNSASPSPSSPPPAPAGVGHELASFLSSTSTFLTLGIRHILPDGLDHILFVLGLFLLSSRTKPLLLQVSTFTLAHSLTLALSLYGILSLPPHIVEPLIALSIAFIAVENLFTSNLHPWRPLIVFAFGLVHGLGFASALHNMHLPKSDFLPALLGFNSGVEIGQLLVIASAFLLVGWFRSEKWYRPTIAVPASLLIAATGLFWTVQRLL